jgi:hypothetical protein
MVTIAAAMMGLNVAAYNPGSGPDNYCIKSINGKMVLEHNGAIVKKEITFKDGSCVKPDGTVITADGERLMLKEGECVNSTSVMNLSRHRDDTWYKKNINKPNKPDKKEVPDKDL